MSVTTISLALEVLLSLLSKTQAISEVIQKANAEGRSELTFDEWANIIDADRAARLKLSDAIEKARRGESGIL